MFLCKAQKELLIEYMSNNEELRSGKFSLTFTQKVAQSKWEESTKILNSVPNGSIKTWKKWRKTWQDLKKNAKAKRAKIIKYERGTGRGPLPKEFLNKSENTILGCISKTQIESLGSESETTTEFPFEQYNEDLSVLSFLLKNFGKEEENSIIKDTRTELTEVSQVENTNTFEESQTEVSQIEESQVEESQLTGQSDIRRNNEELQQSEQYHHNENKTSENKLKTRLTKTSRLQNSLALNKEFLGKMETKLEIKEQYHKEKIISNKITLCKLTI